ncbi:MAG: transposase [Bryobacterales bacterium]|nr:transposase [Bryobacterales bacterium]
MADATDSTVIRSFKFRLLPNKKQHEALERILESQRQLYNGALDHRIGAYRKAGKTMTLYSQQKELTELRLEPEFANVPANLQRWTLRRLDTAYSDFFRRMKNGEKAGFPRFRGYGWWNTFGFAEWSGIRFHGKRIRFKGMPGGLRAHLHRPMPDGKPLCCTFTRDAKGWNISIQCLVTIVALAETGRSVGIDMGLKELCVFSTGEIIPNPKKARSAEKRQRRLQRALQRCERGKKNRIKAKRRLARLAMKTANARRTYLHQVSANLVRQNDAIYIENLNVKGLAGGMLAKSVHDAGWGLLREFITYKAESAGRTVIAVDPKNTTQACSGCGVIVPKKLAERWHECPDCGLSLDRDHNAALNILKRGGTASRASQLKAVA